MEQINNNFEEQEVKWGGLLNEFLWTCAGVNKKILRQCPTDYAKYADLKFGIKIQNNIEK